MNLLKSIPLIEELRLSIEEYDLPTLYHSEQVAYYTVILSRQLGIGKSELEVAYWAGLMHDIGKLMIPKKILNKSGTLSDREYLIMKSHSEVGAAFFNDVMPSCQSVTDGIKFHHERYNGKGYPCGLVGEDIPLISRVIAVADVYQALTSKRPYRNAGSCEDAILYINTNAGSQFDPKIVKIFDTCCKQFIPFSPKKYFLAS